jgi:hypothetical protein
MIDATNMSRHPADIYSNSRPTASKQSAGVVNHNADMVNGHAASPRDKRTASRSHGTDNVVCSQFHPNGCDWSGHHTRPQATSGRFTSNDERVRRGAMTNSASDTAQSAGYDVSRVGAFDRTRRSGGVTEINNQSGYGSRWESAQHKSSGGDAGFGRERAAVITSDDEWRHGGGNHARQLSHPLSAGEHKVSDTVMHSPYDYIYAHLDELNA